MDIENAHGYNNLNLIINDILITKGSGKNIVFAFGKFDKDDILINFEKDDELDDIMDQSDFLIWFKKEEQMGKVMVEKVKADVIILPSIWDATTMTRDIQSKVFHVSDSLKQALEGFDGFGSDWALSGCRRTFTFRTRYKWRSVIENVKGKKVKTEKIECALNQIDLN